MEDYWPAQFGNFSCSNLDHLTNLLITRFTVCQVFVNFKLATGFDSSSQSTKQTSITLSLNKRETSHLRSSSLLPQQSSSTGRLCQSHTRFYHCCWKSPSLVLPPPGLHAKQPRQQYTLSFKFWDKGIAVYCLDISIEITEHLNKTLHYSILTLTTGANLKWSLH